MSAVEKELEERLADLPDADPDFTRCTMFLTKTHGLVDETLKLLEDNPNATTDTVIEFRLEYCGDLEFYTDEGARIPVDDSRLHLTAGMRDFVTQMKGKTFKSYQYAPIGRSEDKLADCNVRINLGQHAVDLNCYIFAFDIGGRAVELGAMHCELMSLSDDFRPWTSAPYHAYAVNERITGVELITDHIEIEVSNRKQVIDMDVAIALRTVHAVYTFSRESWRSTEIRISVADDIAVPYEADTCDVGWLGVSSGEGISIAEVTRKTTKLA